MKCKICNRKATILMLMNGKFIEVCLECELSIVYQYKLISPDEEEALIMFHSE